MKTYIALILAAVFLSACGNNQPASTSNTQPAAGSQSASSKTGSQSAAPQTTTGAPVEFIYGGITPDKANISYKIKVNTDKPIDEVHLALKETDARERSWKTPRLSGRTLLGQLGGRSKTARPTKIKRRWILRQSKPSAR